MINVAKLSNNEISACKSEPAVLRLVMEDAVAGRLTGRAVNRETQIPQNGNGRHESHRVNTGGPGGDNTVY